MSTTSVSGPSADELAQVALRSIPALLDKHGWCQGFDHDEEGAACLRGAIVDVTPAGEVRAYVWDRLTCQVGNIVDWNDTTGRTVDEVQAACVAAAADLRPRADLRHADLGDAYLAGVDLRGVDLGDAYLAGVDLRGANLAGVDLRGANLVDADLWGAELAGVDLRGANLAGVVGLTAAQLAAALNVDKAHNVPTFAAV